MVPLLGARWRTAYTAVSAVGVAVGLVLLVTALLVDGSFLVLLLALAVTGVCALLWPASYERSPTLTVRPDELVFTQRSTLRRPLVVPVEDVAYASVAEGAVAPETPGPLLRLTGDANRRANAMVAFRAPMAPDVRRWSLWAGTNLNVVNGKRVGVLFAAADPVLAAKALRQAVDVRPALIADLNKLRLAPADEARIRRRLLLAGVAVVASGGVLLWFRNVGAIFWVPAVCWQLRRRSQALDVGAPEA